MQKPSVLMIYTGGTIGMINDPKTGVLKAFDFKHLSNQIPELDRLNVKLTAISFEKPVDSSEMNPEKWAEIAQIVFENYESYDGFVILHGSDTMAFTASALSFMLQGLSKPVILTGSQLPIGTIRTDGKENLITSIEIAAAKDPAGNPRIQEVVIYFEYSLYRGNRTSKISATEFEAFSSPNYPELAVAGVSIRYQLEPKIEQRELSLFTAFDNRVALLKIFPGFNVEVYKSLFDFKLVKGIIIETFGAGNAPSGELFSELIQSYISEGGIVLNITQCSTGSVEQGRYETSSFFQAAGVIGGFDLTTEAAVTKMMYALGKYSNPIEIREVLEKDLNGEMTLS
ncbi:MAG: asparaginase [Crocinitomicaceae bacterium]|nr:MAG: asparaginase [Crocinitomicaceae bacterium]